MRARSSHERDGGLVARRGPALIGGAGSLLSRKRWRSRRAARVGGAGSRVARVVPAADPGARGCAEAPTRSPRIVTPDPGPWGRTRGWIRRVCSIRAGGASKLRPEEWRSSPVPIAGGCATTPTPHATCAASPPGSRVRDRRRRLRLLRLFPARPARTLRPARPALDIRPRRRLLRCREGNTVRLHLRRPCSPAAGSVDHRTAVGTARLRRRPCRRLVVVGSRATTGVALPSATSLFLRGRSLPRRPRSRPHHRRRRRRTSSSALRQVCKRRPMARRSRLLRRPLHLRGPHPPRPSPSLSTRLLRRLLRGHNTARRPLRERSRRHRSSGPRASSHRHPRRRR